MFNLNQPDQGLDSLRNKSFFLLDFGICGFEVMQLVRQTQNIEKNIF